MSWVEVLGFVTGGRFADAGLQVGYIGLRTWRRTLVCAPAAPALSSDDRTAVVP